MNVNALRFLFALKCRDNFDVKLLYFITVQYLRPCQATISFIITKATVSLRIEAIDSLHIEATVSLHIKAIASLHIVAIVLLHAKSTLLVSRISEPFEIHYEIYI